MARPYPTYFEDFVRVGSKSTADKKSDLHFHFEDDASDEEAVSSTDYLDTPGSKARSIPGKRSSEPTPLDKDGFVWETSHYTPSEPSSGLRSNTQETSPTDRWYNDDRTEQKLKECQRLLAETKKRLLSFDEEKKLAAEKAEEEKKLIHETAQDEIQALKIRLFYSVRAAKKYDEAEKLYHEIVTDKELDASDDPKILEIRYSFAGMLGEQGKFEEAEPISRAVWDQRGGPSGTLTEEARQSHRQLCSILGSLKRFEKAEKMHRSMYLEVLKDEWALENGDEVCRLLAKQERLEEAKMMQIEIWKERAKQLGERNEVSIQTGAKVIDFVERLIASVGTRAGNGAQRRFSDQRKRAFEMEYEVMLGDVWDSHIYPEQNIEVLNAGHKLGTIHFGRGDFDTAKTILEQVWEGRKAKCGENNASTLATGTLLGKALRYQGFPEAIPRAIEILKSIWIAKRSTLKPTDVETISSGEDLAQTYFAVSELASAEPIYKWIVEQKSEKYGNVAPETIEARWNLGQILYKQGPVKTQEAQSVLGELYDHWKLSCPRSGITSQCGYMLADSLSEQEEKSDQALGVVRDVFNRMLAMGKRDQCYLNSGRLFGLLLLKAEDFPEAQRILRMLWEHQPKSLDESRVRLACGNLYSQSLSGQQRDGEAREILEMVAEVQQAELTPNDPQVAETNSLLDTLSEKTREVIEDKKPQKEKRASKPPPKKRGLWG